MNRISGPVAFLFAAIVYWLIAVVVPRGSSVGDFIRQAGFLHGTIPMRDFLTVCLTLGQVEAALWLGLLSSGVVGQRVAQERAREAVMRLNRPVGERVRIAALLERAEVLQEGLEISGASSCRDSDALCKALSEVPGVRGKGSEKDGGGEPRPSIEYARLLRNACLWARRVAGRLSSDGVTEGLARDVALIEDSLSFQWAKATRELTDKSARSFELTAWLAGGALLSSVTLCLAPWLASVGPVEGLQGIEGGGVQLAVAVGWVSGFLFPLTLAGFWLFRTLRSLPSAGEAFNDVS